MATLYVYFWIELVNDYKQGCESVRVSEINSRYVTKLTVESIVGM